MVDTGDSLTGDQEIRPEQPGQIGLDAMNLMAYDAMALGPNDLFLGQKVLGERAAGAKFPFLSANAVDGSGQLIAKPYVIREMAGHRVAIVGLSGPSASTEIKTNDPADSLRKVMDELKGKADVVIVLSHAGRKVDHQMADSIPGIAAIFGGGAETLAPAWRSTKTGCVVAQGDEPAKGHTGRNMGVAELSFDSSGKLTAYSWRRLTMAPEVQDDPSLAAWVAQVSK